MFTIGSFSAALIIGENEEDDIIFGLSGNDTILGLGGFDGSVAKNLSLTAILLKNLMFAI